MNSRKPSKGDAHRKAKRCKQCRSIFFPEPMGYNALYCSRGCKVKAQRFRKPETFKRAAKRSYRRIKADPERYADRLNCTRIGLRNVRVWLALTKLDSGCADCGYKCHPSALQYDHEGEKTCTISEIRSSRERILHEINVGQCVVRCANCHSVKTWCEKNGIPYVAGMAQDPMTWERWFEEKCE